MYPSQRTLVRLTFNQCPTSQLTTTIRQLHPQPAQRSTKKKRAVQAFVSLCLLSPSSLFPRIRVERKRSKGDRDLLLIPRVLSIRSVSHARPPVFSAVRLSQAWSRRRVLVTTNRFDSFTIYAHHLPSSSSSLSQTFQPDPSQSPLLLPKTLFLNCRNSGASPPSSILSKKTYHPLRSSEALQIICTQYPHPPCSNPEPILSSNLLLHSTD